MELPGLTISKIHDSLVKKEYSALELTKKYLEQIAERDVAISAFLSASPESAISQAKETDKLIFAGKKIPMLAGVPCAIKDNILVKGLKCTAGSKILESYEAPYDATVVKKLKKEGAVLLGKTNLDEFGMGASTENSGFKMTRNPEDLDRVPGGSSGGSAAAIKASECCFALGSDTGGSIRQPASFCGVVGLKPTYGAVSRYGLISFASSLDQVGVLASTVADAKMIFDVISGKDSMDSTSIELPKLSNPNFSIKNLRIGVPKEYFVKGLDKEVEKTVRSAIKKMEAEGAKIEEISLPNTEYALATYYIIAPSEASANLARYDGIKYGLSEKEDKLLDVYLKSRGKGFGAEVKRRIMIGTYCLSSGYYDAYYKKAQQIRNLLREDFKKAFGKVDMIFTPVAPTTAFKIGEKTADPLSMYLSDIYTVSVSLAGLPAISVPCGRANNLPVGLQIIGKHFEEHKILQTASFIEKLVI
ncbi:MAG: Asp-tRNA(Asn)/Glu-tRNA(Gln) amidotransferase subunit GatA [Candidatus Staskawiczbacteria bacterium]|jgi:aspartyl-tRNA(Asn)/glutamyl-tRNA(Gln) amidotransferase subunit A